MTTKIGAEKESSITYTACISQYFFFVYYLQNPQDKRVGPLFHSICFTELSFSVVKDTEIQKVSAQKTSEITSQKKASVQEEISKKDLISEEIKT